MKKFILLYYAPTSFIDQMKDASPEDAKKHMEPWMKWAEKCGDGMVDMGTPLGNAHKMSKGHHGPSESKIVGYSILQAESWDKIKEMTEGHPHLQTGEGCEVEIHECLPLPGME